MRKMRERPIQIYLRPDQDTALRALAKQENVAIAELVRRGIDQYLAQVPVEQDPAMKIIGIAKGSQVRDLSERHGHYIIKALLAESAPAPKSRARRAKATEYKTARRRSPRKTGAKK